eukprot:TRINITY_DN16495_c0_g1_i6.p1 TRINITY_DN16495_c0_g1~~TRINITY_DN16495_c0_g1_i6.p1  ORF type:complete len:434 (+),score=108.45 TRINITY_DN16495_c0_g1_i6:1355-2656(+)
MSSSHSASEIRELHRRFGCDDDTQLDDDLMNLAFVELESNLRGGVYALEEVKHVFAEDNNNNSCFSFINFAPTSLERYALKLQEGFEKLKDIARCQTVIKGSLEFKEALQTTCDASIIQIHGSENEDPITDCLEFPGRVRIVLVHRPEEFILRRSTEGLEFLYRVADVVVLLGKCMVNHYQRLLKPKRVVMIPHGFFDVGYQKSKSDAELIVIGSVTTWGEMRHLRDLLDLHEKVRANAPDSLRLLAYAAGKFDKRASIDELGKEFFKLDNEEAMTALSKAEFHDAESLSLWIMSRANGKPVLHLNPFPKGSHLERWELEMIDFNLQAYREILKDNKPKVEASGTLHLSGGPGIYVVIDCPAMRDIVEDEGAEYVFIPVKQGNQLDFDTAAQSIVALSNDAEKLKLIVSRNIEACKVLGMEVIAGKYISLVKR